MTDHDIIPGAARGDERLRKDEEDEPEPDDNDPTEEQLDHD